MATTARNRNHDIDDQNETRQGACCSFVHQEVFHILYLKMTPDGGMMNAKNQWTTV